MRRSLLILTVLLLAACGDDGGGGGSDALGDDPSRQECIDATRRVLQSLEVPDGVDPADGFDGDEPALAEAAVSDAFRDAGIDPDDEDHPCNAATDDMTEAEFEELSEGIDPEVIAMLGASAEQTFTSTGDAIN